MCQVLMLTVLVLAGFGTFRWRAPARHGLADFGGYRRQMVARRSHFGLCPAATSGETLVLSMVLCGKPTICLHTTNQPGPFGSLDASQVTKQNAKAGFWPIKCDTCLTALAYREQKEAAGYQSRP
jgi:hypothetical protein